MSHNKSKHTLQSWPGEVKRERRIRRVLLADWEELLATNPNYEGKDNVERMIAEAK